MNALRTMFLVSALASVAGAAPLISLSPTGGAITGSPGQTAGWGFTMTADSVFWISVTGSYLVDETSPGIGQYSDLIGLQGGPVDAVLAPGSDPWIQDFDWASATGLGAYVVDHFAPVKALNIATIRVLYEAFSADPTQCGGTCFVTSDFLDIAVQMEVVPTPEPGSGALMMVASVVALIAWRLCRRGARPRRTS